MANGHGGKRVGAGKPKGTLNKSTIEKHEALRLFRQRITEEMEPLMRAHIMAALGGDVRALKELWDRLFGPPKESMDLDIRANVNVATTVVHEYHPD